LSRSPGYTGEPSNGTHHVEPRLEEDHASLVEVAHLAVENSPGVVAIADGDGVHKSGATGRDNSHGDEPHQHHERVKNQYGERVVSSLGRHDLLGEYDVREDDPCDESLYIDCVSHTTGTSKHHTYVEAYHCECEGLLLDVRIVDSER